MPTYQYRCRDCATDLEVVQKFTDDALTECPSCDDGRLRKVFNAVGVVFKGSGFYRTDSRGADTSAIEPGSKSSTGATVSGSGSGSGGTSSGEASSGGTAGKSESKSPAVATAGASAT